MAELHELISKIENPELRAQIQEAANKLFKQKKFGLVFEDHLPECTPLYDIPVKKGATVSLRAGKVSETLKVLKMYDGKALCMPKNGGEAVEYDVSELVTTAELGVPIYPSLQMLDEVCNAPDSDLWHTLIEADNYHALQLLEYLYAGKVDCIYIDPPYNTGARDWKYNNDYVDGNDEYRHSKWLSMMKKRLGLAKKLLNPADSVLIVTIDEKEYLHLGCLLEELFPDADGDKDHAYFGRCKMQMISSVISFKGSARKRQFTRLDEYIFIIEFGKAAVQRLPLSDEWRINPDDMRATHLTWKYLIRSGNAGLRERSPGNFYPVFFTEDGAFHSIGNALPADMSRHEVISPEGTFAVFPVDTQGREHYWNIGPEKFIDYKSKGYIKFGKLKNRSVPIMFLTSGEIQKVAQGTYEIDGYDENGAILSHNEVRDIMPGTQWRIRAHDATRQGTDLLTKVLPGREFPYPKSLYAVHDVIRFFVNDRPSALIVDFFSGSGTTLHAINLLNSEDGEKRRCIMVTNNEVSDDEAKKLKQKGIYPGDAEWESLGIARYVTWPRTKCSITGRDINGKPLKDDYLTNHTEEVDAKRTITQIRYFKDFCSYPVQDQKNIIHTLSDKAITKSSIDVGDVYAISEDDVTILWDTSAVDDWLDALEENKSIHRYLVITDDNKAFKSVKAKIIERFGKNYIKKTAKKMPMSDGFKANAVFFKLGFLDKTKVSLGMQFKELLSTLWMKAGAVGKCPVIEAGVPDMLILPENKMAILNDENQFADFAQKLAEHPEIRVVYLVTDYEAGFVSMSRELDGKITYQLYRDYLDNFRINAGRNGR